MCFLMEYGEQVGQKLVCQWKVESFCWWGCFLEESEFIEFVKRYDAEFGKAKEKAFEMTSKQLLVFATLRN